MVDMGLSALQSLWVFCVCLPTETDSWSWEQCSLYPGSFPLAMGTRLGITMPGCLV